MSKLGTMLNGAPLPNWLKLVALGIVLGVQAAVVYFAQENAVSQLRSSFEKAAYVDSVRTANLEHYIARIVRQGNAEHRRLWRAVGKPNEARDLE